MLLSDFLNASANLYPNKTAIVHNGRKVNYHQLNNMANNFAHYLIAAGLQKQDRVGIYLENSLEAVISIFGTLKASGVFVVINPQAKSKKVNYILNDCNILFLVTDKSLAGNYSEKGINPGENLLRIIITDYKTLQPEVSQETDTFFSETENTEILPFDHVVAPQSKQGQPHNTSIDIDLASLTYTSGSTGEPKGVMLTHLNMVTAVKSITRYLQNTPEDVILNYLPLSFDYGLYQVLMAVSFGGTVVLEKSFVYPFKAIETIIKEKITGLPIVPAMASLILGMNNLSSYNLSSVRYITNTGQALAPSHISGLSKYFPRASVFSMYGLTECKRVSYLPPEEIGRRPLSVGKAMPNTEVWLVDDQGKKIEKAGVPGELVIRGAHVMKGYWNKPKETAQVLKPGIYPQEMILYSRDLFKMDQEGFLYFISRKDDVIKSGGERVSPKEIEDVIYECPGVTEAAVVGVPDKILGNGIKAFVVFEKGREISPDELKKFCSERLERSRVPGQIEIRNFLPKSNNGKIRKKELLPDTEEAENVL
ncbi:Long-chain-fatty-acid--CoA ligase [Chitinispirillum alkaliphilum]|nr:Long-chain-fatty-acid--CoA ligase [Chitinispirillum alkaliphilum]